MALQKMRLDGDPISGQRVASGNDQYFIPAFMMADSAGNEIVRGGTAIGGTSGNVANATCAATLSATASKTNYLTGFSFTFSGATAASVVVATLTGLLGGTQSFIISVPAGVAVGGTPLIIDFAMPRPASAANTAITFSCPALGAGNTNACANIRGIQQ